MLANIVTDFKMAVTMPCYRSGNVQEIVDACDKHLPGILNYMGENAYLCGNAPTYVDFYFFEAYQGAACLTENKLYEKYPKLAAYNANFKLLPGLKEYLATSEEKDRIFNNKVAKLNGKAGF